MPGYTKILIGRGAEALVYLEYWLGLWVICKQRVRKRYRLPEVDRELRRHRTITEAKCMLYARSLIKNVPRILDIDLANFILRMEYIHGVSLKELTARAIADNNLHNILKFYEKVGEYVGILHSNGLIHGDLSLTNVLIKDNTAYLIDFGLSYKHSIGILDKVDDRIVELCARDLNVFMRNVESNFARVYNQLIDVFLEGYRRIVGENITRRVVARVRRIRSLARYVVR